MRKLFLLPATWALLTCSGALAQSATRPTAPSDEETIRLSEFEVAAAKENSYVASESITGSRIRADIRELPFNLNVVTSEFVKDFDLIEFEQMLAYTSSYSSSEVTPTTLQIRGMPAGNLRNGFVTIGLVARSNLDRIEIIKGPYAALYGSTQPGGITNMITKRPGSKNRQSLSLTAGSFDYYRGEISSTGPIGDGKLGYRMDLGYWEKNYSQQFKRSEQQEYSGVISYRFSPSTSASLEIERIDNSRNRGASVPWLQDPVTNQYLGKALDKYYFNTGGPGGPGRGAYFIDWQVTTLDGSFDHKFNDIFSMRGSANVWQRDLTRNNYGNSTVNAVTRTFTAGEPVYGVINRKAAQVFFDFLASFKLGETRHKTLLTFDYRDQDEVVWDRRLPTTDVNNASINSRIINIDNPRWFYPAYSEAAYSRVTADRSGNLAVKGLFASHRAMLWDDKVIVLVGGRYDRPVNSLNDNQTRLQQVLPASNFSPQLGINFTPVKAVTLYASYSESYLPQTQVQSSTQALLPNEEGSGGEFGAKVSMLDGRFNFTTAVYSVERNKILQTVTDASGRDFLEPTGQITSDGFELDSNWQVTSALQILGNYGYNDSAITKNPQALDRVGLPQARVPHHNYGIAMTYRFQAAPKGLTLRLGVTGQSKSLGEYGTGPYTRAGVTYANDRRNELYMPGWNVVDVGASYVFQKGPKNYRHRLSLALKNIFDNRYSTGNWNPADRASVSFTYSLNN